MAQFSGVTSTAITSHDVCTLSQEGYEKFNKSLNKVFGILRLNQPFYRHSVSDLTEKLLNECDICLINAGHEDNKNTNNIEVTDKLLKRINLILQDIEKAIKARIGLLQEAEIVG